MLLCEGTLIGIAPAVWRRTIRQPDELPDNACAASVWLPPPSSSSPCFMAGALNTPSPWGRGKPA
ncbi:MAG: hypothetical protein ACFN9G_07595 [Cardiobacterium sp.]